jgi:hypothetical protein
MGQANPSKLGMRSADTVRRDMNRVLKTSALDHLRRGKMEPENGPIASVLPTVDAVVENLNGTTPASPPPAAPSPVFPVMTVEDFMKGDYVEPGDVILMTRLGSFFAWLLKFFDKSDFAHAAMVFQTPRQTDGLDETFLIETSMSGVEIVSLSQFLTPKTVYRDTGLPPDFVVGVKRFRAPWAQSLHRRIAASRMLHFIQNDDYNFRLLAALASPKTRNIYFKLRDSLRGRAPAIGEFLKNSGSYMPRQFICSGFVQYAYVDMVKAAYHRDLIDRAKAEEALADVIFSPKASMQSEIEELLACTPRNLAETDKLEWEYLIHKGEVFHVKTIADVQRFFKETLPKRIPEDLAP